MLTADQVLKDTQEYANRGAPGVDSLNTILDCCVEQWNHLDYSFLRMETCRSRRCILTFIRHPLSVVHDYKSSNVS